MLKQRSFWLIGLVVALAFSLLAGCGGAAKPAGGGSSGAAASGPTIDKIKARGVLKVGTKVDVPNFGYKDPQTGKVDGYEIDIVRAIAKKILGDPEKFEATGVTAKTRVELLNSDQIDMIAATMTITEDRKKTVDFTDPYYVDGIGMLVKKDSGIKSLKDMNGKTLGVAQGADTGQRMQDQAKKLGVGIKVSQYPTYPETLAALQAGRVDAMSTDASILSGYQKQDASTVLLPDRYSEEPYGIATKKGSDDLAKLVNSVIDEMKKSGELDKLQKKWGIAK